MDPICLICLICLEESGPLKFMHAADIHLDSPLRGLARYEAAPTDELRDATRRAFQNLVDTCLDQSVELLVLAGDIYDGEWLQWRTAEPSCPSVLCITSPCQGLSGAGKQRFGNDPRTALVWDTSLVA